MAKYDVKVKLVRTDGNAFALIGKVKSALRRAKIPKDEIEKVLEYTYTTKEKGLGLGLPIAHKIIEEHGGRMTIESTVGGGSTVALLLPAKGVPGREDDEHTGD